MSAPFVGISIIPGTSALGNFTTAVINFSGSGDNDLVSAVANQTVRCFRLFIVVGGITNLTFKNGTTALTGPLPMAANGGITLDLISPEPWFTASAGNALKLNSSNAVQVSGELWFQQS